MSTPLRGLPYATHGVSSPHLRTSTPAHPQGAADRDARHLAQHVRCLGVAGAAFARHRLPLAALLRCPHHLRAPPPSPPAACSARLPAAPSAVTATQSPCRLLSAGLAGVDSPSLIPWDLSSLTAQRGFGFHTPRISDAGCAIRAYGLPLDALTMPYGVSLLLDRAHIVPIHFLIMPVARSWLRMSYTDTRAIHACRCREREPIHNRHTPIVVASTPVAAFVPGPYTPEYKSLHRVPAPKFPIGRRIGLARRTRSDHIRASDNPKSPRRCRSGSNDGKESMCCMPTDQPLPGLDSGDEKEKERDENRPTRTRIWQ